MTLSKTFKIDDDNNSEEADMSNQLTTRPHICKLNASALKGDLVM